MAIMRTPDNFDLQQLRLKLPLGLVKPTPLPDPAFGDQVSRTRVPNPYFQYPDQASRTPVPASYFANFYNSGQSDQVSRAQGLLPSSAPVDYYRGDQVSRTRVPIPYHGDQPGRTPYPDVSYFDQVSRTRLPLPPR